MYFKLTLDSQFLRFAIVGVVVNLSLYLAYLVITYLGVEPKIAMTILYIAGVSISFFFNKNWTFRYRGSASSTFVNYVLVYACGYFLNLAGLYFLVDKLGFRHEWVQGVLIFLIALLLFAAQKSIVFNREAE